MVGPCIAILGKEFARLCQGQHNGPISYEMRLVRLYQR